jgi:hypothetical protein
LRLATVSFCSGVNVWEQVAEAQRTTHIATLISNVPTFGIDVPFALVAGQQVVPARLRFFRSFPTRALKVSRVSTSRSPVSPPTSLRATARGGEPTNDLLLLRQMVWAVKHQWPSEGAAEVQDSELLAGESSVEG